MFCGEFPGELVDRHPRYFTEFKFPGRVVDENAAIKARTSLAFGFEWTEFSDYDADNYEKMLGPATEVSLVGKTVLELGCGAGRHAGRSAKRGAEVFAVDYSLAIESASQNLKDVANVHLVQGDAFRLPFRPATFDCGYSLGVLHHLHDPQLGFGELVRRVKPGGSVFIWVYKKTLRKTLFEPLRRQLSYIPPKPLKRLCLLLAIIDYSFCMLYKLSRMLPGPLQVLSQAFPSRTREYAEYSFHTSYTDWYDRLAAPIVNTYTEADILAWFRREKLENLIVTSQKDFGVRGLGQRSTT